MKIGSIATANFTVLAPLAGITNLPFRLQAKKAGAGLVYSEMISANGLVHQSPKTLQLLTGTPEEKPLAVQIFGADPAIMADAARMVQESGADLVDINFGCSVKKILKGNAGSALMRDPRLTQRILSAVRRTVTIPLTIKIRSGWDPSGKQALEIARIAQACGVDAVAVHPRTATQGFGGHADWSVIAAVKKSLHIPVIGNGDVNTAEDALRMLVQTGCDGVMVGRAAIGNPWIFNQMLSLLAGRFPAPIDAAQRIATMVAYVQDSIRYLGEPTACRMMRSRLCWFVKGLPNAAQFRRSIRSIASEKEAMQRIRNLAQSTSAGPETDGHDGLKWLNQGSEYCPQGE